MSLLSTVFQNCKSCFCSAVILAAGSSNRMGKDKMLCDLSGTPVLARSIEAFQRSNDVNEIVVVTREELLDVVAKMRQEYQFSKLSRVVIGGNTRTKSALAGVTETSKRTNIICIHDGARPLVSSEIIHNAIYTAYLHKAAVPVVPTKDTIQTVKENRIISTLDRDELFSIQTPQAFQADIIKAALTKAVQEEISYFDDSSAVKALGVYSYVFEGNEKNIKITTPFDLVLGNAILLNEKGDDNK